MDNYKALVSSAFLGVILLIASIKDVSGGSANAAHLIDELFKGYDPDARPVKNSSAAVNVTLSMGYVGLKELDEPTQVANSLAWITLRWNDAFLQWNASEYGGQSTLFLKPTRIWTPDIKLYNSISDEGAHIANDDNRIIVNSEGDVTWFVIKILQSACPIDVSSFPFDTQKCTLRFSSWVYDGLALDLQLYETNGIELKYLKKNAEWELKSISSKRNLVKYNCCPAPFVDLEFTLEFRRKPLYYINTIVFPPLLLALLLCLSFLFPADSGERVSVVITVLLGLYVFMFIVNGHTPVTSDSVPMITKFFSYIGVSSTLALMATAFVLRLNHASSAEPVPSYHAKVRDCIAVALCMKKPSAAKKVELKSEDILLTDSSALLPNVRDLASTTPEQRPLAEERILKELQKFSRHLNEENIAREVKEDWHYTMRVFNRFFFIISVLIFCLNIGYLLSYF